MSNDAVSQFILDKTTKPELIDICLEAMSLIWLRYPTLIRGGGAEVGSVFRVVIANLGKDIATTTKAQLIKTLNNFLTLNPEDLP